VDTNVSWNGMFMPFSIRKHRDYCGDFFNHVLIKEINLQYAIMDETDQRHVYFYDIVVGFVRNPDEEYVYEVMTNSPIGDDKVKAAKYILDEIKNIPHKG
jgi:hypothetical protein